MALTGRVGASALLLAAALALSLSAPVTSFSPQLGLRCDSGRTAGSCVSPVLGGRRMQEGGMLRRARLPAAARLQRLQMTSVEGDGGGGQGSEVSKRQKEFDSLVEEGKVKDCVAVMRAEEELLKVSPDQAFKMLSSIPLDVSEENERQQQVLTSFIYASLRKRGLIRGFGYVPATPVYLPVATKDIDVPMLEAETGLKLSALTPKGTQFSWQLAGLAVCAAEFFVTKELGLDPMQVIPATALVFLADRILLSGAVFESAYRFLFPVYKQKVIKHEAGHFLLAYLLGCPIQGFFLSAWDASKSGIAGQAGTIFFDNDLSSQLGANKVTRTSIDRYSIVVMGGIAAEAVEYDRAEGGASDEETLVSFLVGLIPPWDQKRVLNQARWSVTQATMLIREHKDAYDALAAAMEAGKPLGDCVKAIEGALARELPAEVRGKERAESGITLEPSSTSASSRSKTGSIGEIELQIEEKRSLLKSVESEEARLRERVREIQSEAQKAVAASSPGASGKWDQNEGKRLTEALLAAARKRRAEEAGGGKGGIGGDGKASGKGIDAQLAAATQAKNLAEIDLEIGELDGKIAAVEREIEQLRKENA